MSRRRHRHHRPPKASLTPGQVAYHGYLQSDHWMELRAIKLSDAPKCEKCGCKRELQVHHKVYRDRFEDSRLGDLKTLCRDCHLKAHGLGVKSRKKQKVKPGSRRDKVLEVERAARRAEKEKRQRHIASITPRYGWMGNIFLGSRPDVNASQASWPKANLADPGASRGGARDEVQTNMREVNQTGFTAGMGEGSGMVKTA